ncbi:MAG: hypothetical protein EB084_23425 [Proteobacteria bacterium]|nr:hypothetical protein [Pseudomonadota bacterium]
MTRRPLMIALCAIMLALVSHTAVEAFPGLPDISIPGLGGGNTPDQWFATGLADAVTDVPFLDHYDPAMRVPAQEMPRGIDGEMMLGPGAYDLWAQSYCLTPGGHRPGGGRGDGYVFAPAKGKGASTVDTILRNAWMHPEIDQHDIQVLLWALIAQTPFNQLDPKLQHVAETLLSKKDLDAMHQAANMNQIGEILSQASAYLPGPVQQILNAESTLRGMLSGALPAYNEIESIAVAVGEATHMDGDREIPTGRWSYNPNGYFISFFPEGYTQTLIEVVNPGSLRISIDKIGRVSCVADQSGNSVEIDYDEKAFALQGDATVKVCPFKTVRFKQIVAYQPDKPVTLEVQGKGYALVGLPGGQATPPAGAGSLRSVPARYRDAVALRKQVESLTANICKINKKPEDAASRKSMIPVLVNIASCAEGLREMLLAESPDQGTLANPVYEAFMAGVVVFGENVRKPGSAREDDACRLVAYGEGAGALHRALYGNAKRLAQGGRVAYDGGDGAHVGPKWLKPFEPSNSISQPGNQSRQRLGLSSRNSDHDSSRPPGRRNPRRDKEKDPDKDTWKNKEILVKARECMGYIENMTDLSSLFDDPAQFATGKATSGLGLDMQGTVKDGMFNMIFENAGIISASLGGDPPRPDFNEVTMPEKVDIAAVCQGLKQPPAADSLLGVMLELDSVLRAARIARDRLGGAVQAGNAAAVERQGMVLVELKRRAGLLWMKAATRLEQAADRAEKRGLNATPEQASAALARLKSAGFNKAEQEAAKRLGWSAQHLDEIRAHRLSLTPTSYSKPLAEALREIAASYRELGEMWACLPTVDALRKY